MEKSACLKLLVTPMPVVAALVLAMGCERVSQPSNGAVVQEMPEPQIDLSVDWSESQRSGWYSLMEELEIQELVADLSSHHQPSDYVVENVNVITMQDDTPLLNHAVVVSDGKILAIGPSADVVVPDGAEVIDGGGRWLAPGLTDMHVHNLESHSQHILNVVMGVTTVRDLDGFPFLLKMRDAAAENLLFAPRMFVSGTILNGSDFGGYARKIDTVEEARDAVREQAALGYDFIKTHNSLSAELFLAIVEEAHAQGMDAVGHIPVPVRVETAVSSGMRTFEHFKGYIVDSALTISDEDYVAATDGAEVWNTPTFTTYLNHLRGDDATRVLANEEMMQYVPPAMLQRWKNHAAQDVDQVTVLRQNIYPMSRQIFTELRTLDDAKFLAGTDSGSYELLVPGFVLHEELRIFQELGMTPFEALETATTNAAVAMRQDGEFGVIAPGAAADFVLLEQNPLENIENLQEIEAVAMRGIWIDAAERDQILAQLKDAIARSEARISTAGPVTASDFDDYMTRLAVLKDNGFVYRDHYLDYAASMYEYVGRPNDAERIHAMKTDSDFGFSWFRFE
ncbi:amidohydrolase family protein [Hyphococcus flavus]|uniref:Amidohydrolase family protein n=1 Tax=Hyphococcus flavus TaxID=1866326 RepID=A0AAE9ZCS3_9PROT|nr:amidohydrolase family protein [Hyphococcus flavus]WDI30213.1 amidohydrolase family protein [Hyphococcus flavus]